ncbi:hypothetical protein BXZ70DRAFT_886634 [Cristinia sonorae]|uniref:Pentatricopeptide repeat-containing protein n=1 Tax=Cristinia sonorae TaxID=1940300 RepID=A0A8K0UWL1_9AGAR|nr:hypothetical protein BXZ70DRAFT_886634 [Cristinia sonorae]
MQHINTARKFEKSIQALQCAEGSRVLTGQRKPAPAHTPNIALALLDEGEEGGLSAHSSCHTTRDDCLQTLATTNSLSDAWHAYETLLALPRDPACLHIPWEYLHRLTRLIASTKPRTRPLFIRLMSVVSTIHRTGGRVQLWQWNALVDFAGKGWRKTKQEDFRNAFDIYNDLVASRSPGATFLRSDPDADYGEKSLGNPEPDIVTLTTLLHIATRTMHKPTVQYAARLHQTSGLPPNRITLLTFLQYFTRKGDLAGIRHIISQMVAYDFDVGIDGVNAYIWAYGRNGRLDVAGAMYAILRARVFSSEGNDASTTAAVTYLQETERIVVPEGVVPDRITYTGLIQAYAFHGYLTRCLQVFNDYARMVKQSEDHKRQALFTLQMVPIYRAIFIGFTRHGRHHLSDRLQNLQSGVAPEPSAWNMETLEALFVDFLTIPADIKASPKMLYWIMVAFARTSGGDTMKLQEVFVRLRERFPHNWDGRLQRLWKKLFGKYQRPR